MISAPLSSQLRPVSVPNSRTLRTICTKNEEALAAERTKIAKLKKEMERDIEGL